MAKPINHTNEQQKKLLAELKQLQLQLGLSDQAFAQRYLSFSGTTYYRLINDQYTGDTAGSMEKAAIDLQNLREEISIQNNIRPVGGIYQTRHVRAISAAITEARAAQTNNRAVFYLAPTGGGKTTICEYIADKFKQPIIEATEAWRTSYLTGCARIAEAFGSKETMNTARRAEAAMLNVLSRDRRVLIIDEGNTFGPHTANMLKLILNKTDTVILVAAIPFLFQRMQLGAWAESSQLIRRTTTFIHIEQIADQDIAPMFDPDISPAALSLITKAANQFGLFDMAARIRDDLGNKNQTVQAVEQSIIKTKACIGVRK